MNPGTWALSCSEADMLEFGSVYFAYETQGSQFLPAISSIQGHREPGEFKQVSQEKHSNK